jgi:hypothetical protein
MLKVNPRKTVTPSLPIVDESLQNGMYFTEKKNYYNI